MFRKIIQKLKFQGKKRQVYNKKNYYRNLSYLALLSYTEPQNVNETCKDECWVQAMNEELEQIEMNNTWELVPRPHVKNIIGTKWIFKKMLNENGEVITNKARLVCKDMLNKKVQILKKHLHLMLDLKP